MAIVGYFKLPIIARFSTLELFAFVGGGQLLNYGLREVMNLQPVSFNWKDPGLTGNKIGFIAQDVRRIIPEVVVGDESKETIGMSYAELVPVLVNAIKEQQQQIEELNKRLKALESK